MISPTLLSPKYQLSPATIIHFHYPYYCIFHIFQMTDLYRSGIFSATSIPSSLPAVSSYNFTATLCLQLPLPTNPDRVTHCQL